MSDTKAHWRRRALKAESEVNTMRDFRRIDAKLESSLAGENAALKVCLLEIREALDAVEDYPKGEE